MWDKKVATKKLSGFVEVQVKLCKFCICIGIKFCNLLWNRSQDFIQLNACQSQ